MDIESVIIDKVKYAEIPEGITIRSNYILYKSNQKIKAILNRCKHEGGRFIKGNDEGTLICPRHGWNLDLSKMEYTNPVGVFQETLRIEQDGEDIIIFNEKKLFPKKIKSDAKSEDILISYFSHACAEIKTGGKIKIITDPWLIGPAFTKGWWLKHRPPANWRERVIDADMIYISHNHSDHLNKHTLREIARINSEVPIVVPNFKSSSCQDLIKKYGLKNISVHDFNKWYSLGPDTRYMLLIDGTGRDDSGILIEHKNYRILNTVDCSNLNSGDLPEADVLLTSFAGGASGYPVCWEELYGQEGIKKIVRKNKVSIIKHLVDHVKAVNPDIIIPFAGYFHEKHRHDNKIRILNEKNTPYVIEKKLKYYPEIKAKVWVPEEGSSLYPLSFKTVLDPQLSNSENPQDWDSFFNAEMSINDYIEYFKKSNFTSDLILHLVLCDDEFSAESELIYDFQKNDVIESRPHSQHRYLRIRVRTGPFNYVLKNKLPWEELSIGFQCRFYREPDCYNFDFWNHFQNIYVG